MQNFRFTPGKMLCMRRSAEKDTKDIKDIKDIKDNKDNKGNFG